MIIGIGHDLTQISRISKIFNGTIKDTFIKRILTQEEHQDLQHVGEQREVEFVAGRFAAKEAVSKAFGCGIGTQLSFQDITIIKLPSGKPQCAVSQEALIKLGYEEKKLAIHLSITHEKEYASAFVVVEQL